MRRSGLLLAAGVVLLVNALVLGRVAWNRSGEPDATVTLTEREAPLAGSGPGDEGSGVSLRLTLARPPAGLLAPGGPSGAHDGPDPGGLDFLDAARLAALGFELRLPSAADTAAEARRAVNRQLPRRAYGVLEVGGAGWTELMRRLDARLALVKADLAGRRLTEQAAADLQASAERLRRNGSRLFIVEVGLDAEALRREYPDRHAHPILPVTVRPVLLGLAGDGRCLPPACHLGGTVTVLTEGLSVPRSLHAALPGLGPRHEGGPGYQVELSVGRSHEPWITAIRPPAPSR